MFRKMYAVLKPKSWKSDSQLDRKKVNRYEVNPKDGKNGLLSTSHSHSKSSDWTEVDLEVPEKDQAIHLKNPQLSFMFSDNTTPTPPPRKHKKSLREKFEAVAKNSISALQSKKGDDTLKLNNEERVLADEVICVKKIIRYGCPACEGREECMHKADAGKSTQGKKRKSASVVSLPNYNDMKLSLTNPGEDFKYIDASVTNSANSLPTSERKRSSTASVPTGRFENYMTRCRSFGSLLNNKLKMPKKSSGNESDDSFGGLEDWDLGMLEHYNPKEASLPRPRPRKPEPDVLSDIEQLIVPDEEIEPPREPPQRPLRRSESLVKKISQEVTESVIKGNPETFERDQRSPDHSSLMRILQEVAGGDVVPAGNDGWCKTPAAKINEDFINAERVAVS